MDILNNAYHKCLVENEKNLRFWEEYVNSLNSLDFSAFSDKLSVPALVPIGNRILFRGELKHTNEVTVALGTEYFVKCSLKQAEVLRQHRIKDAQSKLEIYQKEKEYLEKQLSCSKECVNENVGQDFVEVWTEEEDRAWRKQHRANMRQYKLKSKSESESTVPQKSDEDLWYRLEELELQEELNNELFKKDQKESDIKTNATQFVVMEPDVPPPRIEGNKGILKENPDQTSDILQQVLEKQNELEQKLLDLRNRERSQPKTEEELISRLNEMQELDELEDEMDRLQDILQTEDAESSDEDDSLSRQSSTTKRGVTFADEYESETIEIDFKHSDNEATNEPYNPEKGITKPSDIYTAYSNLFTETTSILKKTKYEDSKDEINQNKLEVQNLEVEPNVEFDDNVVNRTIVVKDIVEKQHGIENKLENSKSRPTSLFKKKRLQKK